MGMGLRRFLNSKTTLIMIKNKLNFEIEFDANVRFGFGCLIWIIFYYFKKIIFKSISSIDLTHEGLRFAFRLAHAIKVAILLIFLNGLILLASKYIYRGGLSRGKAKGLDEGLKAFNAGKGANNSRKI